MPRKYLQDVSRAPLRETGVRGMTASYRPGPEGGDNKHLSFPTSQKQSRETPIIPDINTPDASRRGRAASSELPDVAVPPEQDSGTREHEHEHGDTGHILVFVLYHGWESCEPNVGRLGEPKSKDPDGPKGSEGIFVLVSAFHYLSASCSPFDLGRGVSPRNRVAQLRVRGASLNYPCVLRTFQDLMEARDSS
jgi:hypothetical protein